MSTTKTKRSKKDESAFPVPQELTRHQPLEFDETIPTEPQSFEKFTTKAEVQVEIIRLSDLHRSLTEQILKIEALGRGLNSWGEKNFGPLFQIGPAITMPASHVDGRKIFNPEKNLKISAIRSYGWAKSQGKTADEARTRAIEVVQKKAVTAYNMSKVPEGVRDYIELLHTHYDKIGTEAEIPAA